MGVAGFRWKGLRTLRGVTKDTYSLIDMERSAVERKSRVGEIGYPSLDGIPKYHGTRETLWESGWTITQG
jgi:hypothetical protein